MSDANKTRSILDGMDWHEGSDPSEINPSPPITSDPTWAEIVQSSVLAEEHRREARRLRKIADETDAEAARIEASVGLVLVTKGDLDA